VKRNSAVKIPTSETPADPTIRLPAFAPLDSLPASVLDKGKVRLGTYTPMFPALPAK
jgi:hypothetical protein